MKNMILVLMILFALLPLSGCRDKVAVRDAKTYKAELDYFDAEAAETVERGTAVISRLCVCVEVMGQTVFANPQCRELAETIMVIKARHNYHTAYMRFLGDVSKHKPNSEPPAVEAPETLCERVAK